MSLTTGVIGCGNISKFHFSGLEKAGVKIKWVCDLSEESARAWIEKYSAKFTKNFMDIINDPDVDMINLTAISSVHKPICTAAIDAGKAVICEKTLAENAEDALAIVKKAEEKGTIFYTSYMKRFLTAVEKAKELLPSIGRIISTHIRVYQPWGKLWDGNPDSGFAHTPSNGMSIIRKNYGGGILVCGGSHILDLVCFFLGRPNKIYGKVFTPDDRDYDLQASALLETNNGSVHFDALAHPLNKIGFLHDGWDERIEIIGLNGRLEIFSPTWDKADVKGSLLKHYNNATGTETEHPFSPVSPFDIAMQFFCDNIAKGEQGAQSRLTGYDVDELISHFKQSSETGKALEIDWKIQ